jgi:tetratricopeptide (TPR) repeat protein
MTQSIDRDGRSTVASAEGQAALGAGDTERARDWFAQAGENLEREMMAAMDDETKHLLRFLAATQFYKGGHYRRALALANKIKEANLPAPTRRLLPKFLQDVNDRASPDFEGRVKARLLTLWAAKDYTGIIELLQEHPYVVPPWDLAFIRAVCCEMLGKYRPAVLFFADAARRSQNNPGVLEALAALPLHLPSEGRLPEAWEYVQAQVELFPNAVSYAVASLLCYHRGLADEDARTSLFKEQAQYFDRAREEYARLPPAHQDHAGIKAVMGLGYEAAALALHRSGDVQAALEMCQAAIVFDPASPNAWTILGTIRSGGPEAAAAFKKAVELGDRTYFPFYYLAYHALTRGEFREALGWSQQALERGESQDNEVKSLLYQWAAISLAHLNGPREQIEALFKKAVEVAPDNEFARRNYRHFQASGPPEPPPLVPRFEEQPRQANDRIIGDQGMLHGLPTHATPCLAMK